MMKLWNFLKLTDMRFSYISKRELIKNIDKKNNIIYTFVVSKKQQKYKYKTNRRRNEIICTGSKNR